MAIILLPQPTGGAPVNTTDYNYQNVIQQAMMSYLDGRYILTEWYTTTKPAIGKGAIIPHAGGLYIVDSADEAISGTPADGRCYIKLTASNDVITASLITSLTGYSYSYIYNGWYHADGTQLMPYVILKESTSLYTKTSFFDTRFIENQSFADKMIYPWKNMNVIVQDDSKDSIPLPVGMVYWNFGSPNLSNSANSYPLRKVNTATSTVAAFWTNRRYQAVNGGFLVYGLSTGNEGVLAIRFLPQWAYDVATSIVLLSNKFSSSNSDSFVFFYIASVDQFGFDIYDDAGNTIIIRSMTFTSNAQLRVGTTIFLTWSKTGNNADMYYNGAQMGSGGGGSKTIIGTGITNLAMAKSYLAIGVDPATSVIDNIPEDAAAVFNLQDIMSVATAGTTYLSQWDGTSDKPYYDPTWLAGYQHNWLIKQNGDLGARVAHVERLITKEADIQNVNVKKYVLGGARKLDTAHSLQGAQTSGSIFTALAPFVPNINDECLITGGIYVGGLGCVVSKFSRSSSTVVNLYCLVVSGGVPYSTVFGPSSGGATVYDVALAW